MLSDTLQQSMIQHTHSDTKTLSLSQPDGSPLLDEVIIAEKESPCIDCPFSTRAPRTYILLCVSISQGLQQQRGNTAA